MGKDTKIGWTHRARPDGTMMPGFSFNAWWGCQKVSPACRRCYAEKFAKRTGHDVWGASAPRRFFGDAHWNEPRRWNAAAEYAGEQHLVFCSSMADVLEDRDDLVLERARLVDLIETTPNLIWLLLTKRPENQHLLPAHWTAGAGRQPKNVWFGTTIENQEWSDIRLPHLARATWAAIRFLSVEPMLGRIFLNRWLKVCQHWKSYDDIGRAPWCPDDPTKYWWEPQALVAQGWRRPIDWMIIGGESGSPRTELDLPYAADLAAQARAAGVAVYVKQDSGPVAGLRGRLPDELWALKEHPAVPPPAS